MTSQTFTNWLRGYTDGALSREPHTAESAKAVLNVIRMELGQVHDPAPNRIDIPSLMYLVPTTVPSTPYCEDAPTCLNRID